ncbi:MAG: prephenate dehydrogenase/arogenate dehydrogenase family protein [Ruminococcaceae bacterium]|nr:prephenate dehydrogenase/arogenate dehydrogenase family protein [Oscillospiraceae bacterium]
MKKNVAVIGMGLIGGSIAKAFKKHTNHTIWGYNRTRSTLETALSDGAIDMILTEDDLSKCDMVIIALYPDATIEFVKSYIERFARNTVIIDCSGTKEAICRELSPLAHEHGLYFIGGHPMAGIERSGYKYSYAEMYEGATMILCRDEHTNLIALKAAELLFLEIGFGGVTVTDSLTHDKQIAFTSQLAHVVSNAYIKSPTAKNRAGFSAGSYKDLTRVARLNEDMWTDLFFENKENLKYEIDYIIKSLGDYRDALEEGNKEKMRLLLKEGREAKEEIG